MKTATLTKDLKDLGTFVELKKSPLIRFRGEDGGGVRLCSLTEIGEGGMRLVTDSFIQRDRTYIFELILPFLKSTAIVKAGVVSQATNAKNPRQGRYRCELAFLDVLPEKHGRDLREYVDLRTGASRPASDAFEAPPSGEDVLPVVLTVDRDGALTARLERVLDGKARVVRCREPRNAAALAKELNSPLVAMENNLEEFGPAELGPELKSDRATRNVLLTVFADGFTAEDVVRCKDAGVDRFLLNYMSDGHLAERLTERLTRRTSRVA